MIQVKQFRYSRDNLGYVLYVGDEAVVIDGGCPEDILLFLKENDLRLTAILNTHDHYDHTPGNRYLSEQTGVKPAMNKDLGDCVFVGAEKIEVIPTPGHSLDSVCFYSEGLVITGDTLFIATVGNCFSGEYSLFQESLDKLLVLPDDTIVYPGHDYTKRSLRRAERIEPDNGNIKIFKKKYNPPLVASTIGDEKKINPYLRTGTPVVKEHIKSKGKNTDNEFECFKSFLELY